MNRRKFFASISGVAAALQSKIREPHSMVDCFRIFDRNLGQRPCLKINRVPDFLEQARERFRLSDIAEDQRRAEMLKDLQFRAGDQWQA